MSDRNRRGFSVHYKLKMLHMQSMITLILSEVLNNYNRLLFGMFFHWKSFSKKLNIYNVYSEISITNYKKITICD